MLSMSRLIGKVTGLLGVLRFVAVLVLSVLSVWSLYKTLVLAIGVNGCTFRRVKKAR